MEPTDPQLPTHQPPMPRARAYRTQSERNTLILGMVMCVVILAFCTGGVAFIVHLVGGGSSGGQPVVVATAAATKTPAPTATATVDPQVSTYTLLVATDLATLAPAMQQTGTDCQNEDLSACRADLQQVQDLTTSFLADLDNTPAPPCLQAADGKLREALLDIENGSQLGGAGINDSNAQEINDGAAMVRQGGQLLSQATSDVEAATCP